MEELTDSSDTNRLGLITLLCSVFGMSEECYTSFVAKVQKVQEAHKTLFITQNLMFDLHICEKILSNNYYLSVLRSLISIWILCLTASPEMKKERKNFLHQFIYGTNEVDSTIATLYEYSNDDLIPKLVKKVKLFSTAVMGTITESINKKNFRTLCREIGIGGSLLKSLLNLKYNFEHNARGTRCTQSLYFMYSLNMMKRGLSRLPESMVVQELCDTIKGLNAHPDPLSTRAKKAIDFAVQKIWDQADWNVKSMNRELNRNVKVPSASSVEKTNKMSGGGKRMLYDCDIRNKDMLCDYYCSVYDKVDQGKKINQKCRFAALIEPNKVRPISIQDGDYQLCATPMKEFLLSTWKKTSFGTMTDDWQDKILQFDYSPEFAYSSVDYTAATNKMKPDATLCCLVSFLKQMKNLWSDENIFEFDKFAQFQIDCVAMREFKLDGSVIICGSDKESPVTPIKKNTLIDWAYSELGITVNSERPIIPQNNGQLMGNPLSFVLLCAINLASVILSYDPEMLQFDSIDDWIFFTSGGENLDFNSYLNHTIINGDDAVYRFSKSDMELPQRQKEIAKWFGLEVNELKTWIADRYLSLNSELFYFQNREEKAVRVGYLNQSILWNNNIKNTNGIDKNNIASCTEYVFRNGPHKSDDNLTFYWSHLFDYTPNGDLNLSREFFEFHAILRLSKNERKFPFAPIADSGLGFNYGLPFLKTNLPKLKLSDPILEFKAIYNHQCFTSESYQTVLMSESHQLLYDLVVDGVFIECPESDGLSANDLARQIADFKHPTFQYSYYSDAHSNFFNWPLHYFIQSDEKYFPRGVWNSKRDGKQIKRDARKLYQLVEDIPKLHNEFYSMQNGLLKTKEMYVVGDKRTNLVYDIPNPFIEYDPSSSDEEFTISSRSPTIFKKGFMRLKNFYKVNPQIFKKVEISRDLVIDESFDIYTKIEYICGLHNFSSEMHKLFRKLLLNDSLIFTGCEDTVKYLSEGIESNSEEEWVQDDILLYSTLSIEM